MTEVAIRPLARSLAPLPEESLPGYLLRLSYRLGRSPARVGMLSGLSGMHHRLPGDYLLALPTQLADAFAHTTRLSSAEAQSLTLAGSGLVSAYAPLAATRLVQGRNHAAARSRWAINISSRFCPRCLAGDGSPVQSALGGAWKLRWHLPVVFACLEHSNVLASACQRCHNPPNQPPRTERSGLLMQRATAGLHPAQCRHPLPGPQSGTVGPKGCCGARLDQSPSKPSAIPARDLERALALQLRINQNLFPTSSQLADRDQLFFNDLIAVSHLIKFSWPMGASLLHSAHLSSLIDNHAAAVMQRLDQQPRPGPRPSSPWSAPDDPAQCAALLTAADELLRHSHTGEAELRDLIQPLMRASLARLTPNLAASFRRMEFSPALARALARKINGFYHAGGHRGSKRRTPSRECLFRVEHVPALLPASWMDAHFTPFQDLLAPLTNWNARHLRRAASLKLAEMAGGGTWPECAQALSTPWNTAQQSLKVVKRLLDSNESREAFAQAVEQVARVLDDQSHRIDYANRRGLLSSWHLPRADWRHICAGLETRAGRATSPGPAAATALVWAQVTQGDYLHSPALGALRSSGRSTGPVVTTVNQILHAAKCYQGEKAQLADRLRRYADLLADACDRSEASPQGAYSPFDSYLVHGDFSTTLFPPDPTHSRTGDAG
ncbi:TniQ family protein [Streptomyces virginiae]|uniref:TniQ family protein n=1 Tax=Streptomyces virginiae TaxID=1961 RepID=UPI00364B2906